ASRTTGSPRLDQETFLTLGSPPCAFRRVRETFGEYRLARHSWDRSPTRSSPAIGWSRMDTTDETAEPTPQARLILMVRITVDRPDNGPPANHAALMIPSRVGAPCQPYPGRRGQSQVSETVDLTGRCDRPVRTARTTRAPRKFVPGPDRWRCRPSPR